MTAETDDDEVVTGVRRIATRDQWAMLVERLRAWAKEARGFEMITSDERFDIIAEGVESIRDAAVREFARRSGKRAST